MYKLYTMERKPAQPAPRQTTDNAALNLSTQGDYGAPSVPQGNEARLMSSDPSMFGPNAMSQAMTTLTMGAWNPFAESSNGPSNMTKEEAIARLFGMIASAAPTAGVGGAEAIGNALFQAIMSSLFQGATNPNAPGDLSKLSQKGNTPKKEDKPLTIDNLVAAIKDSFNLKEKK